MKYIDSEKLIAEIERRMAIVEKYKDTHESAAAARQELIWTKNFIQSLQQDHLPDAGKMVESEHIADVSKMMEQPEVDLEKEYQEFCKDYPFPWSSQYVNSEYLEELCLSIARHFYKLGLQKLIADKQVEELRGQGSGPDYNTTEGRFRNAHKFQQEQPGNMIQWTGNNLKEVIDFTGKSPRFGEWFNSWEEYENYVHTHNFILKLFSDDGSHFEVPVGAWIVKTPDGYNVPSVARFIHAKQEQPEVDLDAIVNKAKAYDDALERAKRIKDGKGNWRFSDLSEIVPAVTEIFPVLAESEDERMRMLFDCLGSDCTLNRKLLEANGCSIEEMLAFIEKEREEAEKRHERIEQRWKEVQEIDRSMRELRKNLFGEEKEQKPLPGFDELTPEEKMNQPLYLEGFDVGKKAGIVLAEQKPDIELIQRAWYMEGYFDGEYKKEPMWIIKTGKGGPKYKKNERYGQPLPDPKPAEWSEEEKRKLNRIYQILGWAADTHAYSTTRQLIGDKEAIELQDFLRSIVKPTINLAEWSDEENINALIAVIKAHYNDFPNARGLVDWLKSLLSRPKSSDNLPKWKKASAGTKLPSESVIRRDGEDPRFGSVAVYDCEYITINELGKLPKED